MRTGWYPFLWIASLDLYHGSLRLRLLRRCLTVTFTVIFFKADNPSPSDARYQLVAQPMFQEPPPAFSHASSSYWSNPSAYEAGGEAVCLEAQNNLEEARDHLLLVKTALLERIECCPKNCTKIIISSVGRSLLRHPPRFGQYALETLYEGYPAFTRKASGQSIFYKEEYTKWMYAHKFERWVIGPTIGDESVVSKLSVGHLDPEYSKAFWSALERSKALGNILEPFTGGAFWRSLLAPLLKYSGGL